mmetsp:Transcript_17491/g.26042  ORF Transcript_17491/g.26042 Transcript_17491/m.26042 type:complete len:261 (-) Transcript_17491:262-1044(-)
MKNLLFHLLILVSHCISLAMSSKVFVVGATGATGKHVVRMLLNEGNSVVTVVRSKDTLMGLLDDQDYGDRLEVKESAILDLTHDDLVSLTKDCSAIVSCLGHNLTFKGIWGKPRQLVTDTVKRLTKAMPENALFLLMGSDGVAHPIDPKRTLGERIVIFLLRYLIPPHADNEMAADYLYNDRSFNWIVVRPTDLVDEETASKNYDIFDKSEGSLFGGPVVSRANVAHFMVELIKDDKMREQYKHQMPVIKHKLASEEKEL